MKLHGISAYPLGIAAVAAVLITAVPAAAQSSDAPSSDTVTISAGGTDAAGRIAVNAAAGTFNQQANALAIAESETVFLTNTIQQSLIGNSVCTLVDGECTPNSTAQTASITGEAFAGASGAIAVNGAAGVENQQANLASFGIGDGIDSRVASLSLLSQVRGSQEPAGDPNVPAAEKTANISSQAFTDASGLVQVNLTAGERNSSANLFALTITGGTD
jgi:hypothetical protein